MIPLPLLDGDTLVLDNSTLELFQTCPRAALYGICLRKKGSGDRPALKFGGITHKVLETRYRSAAPMLEQTPEVQSTMLSVAEAEFSTYTPPIDDFRNLDRMVDLIHRYGQAYPFEPFEIARFSDGRPLIEVPFAVPLGEIRVDAEMCVQPMLRNPDGDIVKNGQPSVRKISTIRILFTGRIDLAYLYNSGLYILDHKTASMATNMAEFEIAHQFYGYTNATEELLGREVAGIVINRIVCRKPSRTGEPFTFERKLIPVQRGLVSEWKTDILHIIADFVEMVRRQYMPKHTQWCVAKFGPCQFHRVCTLGDTADALSPQRKMMLESGEFEDNTWSPLKETT